MSKAQILIDVMKTIDVIKPNGILVCGLNGAGKTTFARELAKKIGYKHMDIEDYFFLNSTVPYTHSRTKDEYAALLLEDINKNLKFVLSSVIGDFGVEITGRFDLAIMLNLPLDERLRRIKNRDFERFGERILPGGDMYESEQKFLAFVKTRPKSHVENWLKTLSCPVIIIGKTKD